VSWAITEVTIDNNGLTIATALLQGTVIAVSNGSFKDNQGTSAFIIEGTSEVGRLVGVNVIPGVVHFTPADPTTTCDMLQHIHGMTSSSPLKFTSGWIESHEDNKKSFAKIDQWGQLNMECDGMAKSYWNTTALTNGWVSRCFN
jgi:hypothetical protein